MPRFRSANEMVILETESVPLLAEFGCNGGGEFFRRFAGGLCGTLYLLPVFVCPGSEQYGLKTLHTFAALDDVGCNGGVRVADVWRRIDVIDGCGEIVFHRELFRYAKLASAIISFNA